MAKLKILYDPDGNPGSVFLKTKGGKWANTLADDILYIQANGNCTNIITLDGKHTLSARLGVIMKQIADKRFVQVSRSCFANFHKVESFKGRCIYMNKEEIEIMISDTYKAAFDSHFKRLG